MQRPGVDPKKHSHLFSAGKEGETQRSDTLEDHDETSEEENCSYQLPTTYEHIKGSMESFDKRVQSRNFESDNAQSSSFHKRPSLQSQSNSLVQRPGALSSYQDYAFHNSMKKKVN